MKDGKELKDKNIAVCESILSHSFIKHLFDSSGFLTSWAAGSLWHADSEAVLESSVHNPQVSHTASTGGLSSLSLLRPVI